MVKAKDDFLNFATADEKMFIINALKDNVYRKIRTFLYSARKHGDDANNFHKHCDNQGELLYVVKSTNNVVFAIYVSKPLLSDNNSRTDSLQMVISPSHNFAVSVKEIAKMKPGLNLSKTLFNISNENLANLFEFEYKRPEEKLKKGQNQ